MEARKVGIVHGTFTFPDITNLAAKDRETKSEHRPVRPHLISCLLNLTISLF